LLALSLDVFTMLALLALCLKGSPEASLNILTNL